MKPKLKLIENVQTKRRKTAVRISKSDKSHRSGRIIKKKRVKKLGKDLLNTSNMNLDSNNTSKAMKIVSRNAINNKRKTVRKDSEIVENVSKISTVETVYKRKLKRWEIRRQLWESSDSLIKEPNLRDDNIRATLIYRAEKLDETIHKLLWKKFEDLQKKCECYPRDQLVKDYRKLLKLFLKKKPLQLENITLLSEERKKEIEEDIVRMKKLRKIEKKRRNAEKKRRKIAEKKGGNVVEQKGGNVVEQKGGNVVEKKGRNVVEKKGRNVVEKKGRNVVEKKGRNVVNKKGRNVVNKKGRNVVNKKGRNVVNKKGRNIVNKKGRNVVNKKGRNVVNKKGRNIFEKEGEEIVEKKERIGEIKKRSKGGHRASKIRKNLGKGNKNNKNRTSLGRKEHIELKGKTKHKVSKANESSGLPKIKSYEIVM